MDKYRKIKVKGKGNFGYAVLVQSNIDRKYYIMKVLPQNNMFSQVIDVIKMDKKQKEEAVREVQILKQMKHPYIVTYRESFIDKA